MSEWGALVGDVCALLGWSVGGGAVSNQLNSCTQPWALFAHLTHSLTEPGVTYKLHVMSVVYQPPL